jgi:queuine tRNA-ribosyltransferase
LRFTTLAVQGRARRGRLFTRRGALDTPVFMPVGTVGSVKSLAPEEVAGLGARIILGNTYHLLLRPGVEVVDRLGGLHRFMNWPGAILTDSGGFQVFSLAARREVDEDGVSFRSHINGELLRLTPEKAVAAQESLHSDLMMMLDECPPPGAERDYLVRSLERDARWAARALAARSERGGALLGIVQGGVHADLRAQSAAMLKELPLDGYALGGLSVGEPRELMLEVIEATVTLLPKDKPIYLMGVGAPLDLVDCVALGVDMFDCVMPTRMARNGTLLTRWGRLNLRNARFATDPRPVEEDCNCPACRNYSRAYMRHLFMARELLAYRLATLHNLYYILGLMDGMRRAIVRGEFDRLVRGLKNDWQAGESEHANHTQGDSDV